MIITNNTTNGQGGGFSFSHTHDDGGPKLTNSIITNNTASHTAGGGTINPYGYAEIENVKFLNNNLSGLHVQYSSALITNCQFSGNNYGLSSGGLLPGMVNMIL